MEISECKSKREEVLRKLNEDIDKLYITKKDGTKEPYDINKIKTAIRKASERVSVSISEDEMVELCVDVYCNVISKKDKEITVKDMHNIVEASLSKFNSSIAESYRNYRNYKQDFVHMLDKVYQESQRIMYLGDKSNANADSSLVTTKRSLMFGELSKELYKKFFLNVDELAAIKDGYIYIHDISSRLLTTNCCIADIQEILKGGFELANIWYNEPKSLDVAFGVIADITLSASGCQYGGFSLGEVDKLLEPYAEKSYKKQLETYLELGVDRDKAEAKAFEDIERMAEQGFQEWEYKFNTLSSARGDFSFISTSFGLGTSKINKMLSKKIMEVRAKGEGKDGNRKPVLFPKLIFLYDENLHGEGKELEDVFKAAVECNKKSMYPDYVSLSGPNYVSQMYQKYETPITPMGSVDGDEIIRVKLNEEDKRVSIYNLWAELSQKYPILDQVQTATNTGTYIEPENLHVWDTTTGGWVEVRFMTENICKEWRRVVTESGKVLTCTADHPLQTLRGRVLVQEFRPDEKLLCINEGEQVAERVVRVEHISHGAEGYDLTTSSDKFDVSNICSHNCRSFLSPWFEEGGMHPANDNDTPIFVGRGNMGVISLNMPMIYAKAQHECKDFYEVLDYYLEMVRHLHLKTKEYLGSMKASCNPLMYMEGGFYKGRLQADDCIAPVLESFTTSFGVTALNELNVLYNGKTITEDGEFPLQVMRHMNEMVDKFKEEDGVLHSIYYAPAESLCFSGDTVIQAYGGDKMIKDLKEGDLVYSYNEERNKIELKPVLFSGMTKRSADVIKVHFTNGQSIVCTPNHPIAVRKIGRENGKFTGEYIEYVEAGKLAKGDRVKSNYRKEVHGRYRFTSYQYEHDIVAEYFFGKKPEGFVVHHKDHNKKNNLFENLTYMLDADHRREHLDNTIRAYCYTSGSQKGEPNSFYGKKHSNEARTKNREAHLGKNNIRSREIVKVSLDNKILSEYESSGHLYRTDSNFKNVSLALNGKSSLSTHPQYNGHYHKGYLWYFKEDIKNYSLENHIVERVEIIENKIDVYDITVQDNHNFYVGGDNGILVHNCHTQVLQFREKYGIIKGVSDREYMTNGFHCHVAEDIDQITKQNLEERFLDTGKGGQIFFNRFDCAYNTKSFETLIRRAMKKGFYFGTNLRLSYCEECGYEGVDLKECPHCGSTSISVISRVCGYLGWEKVKGDTRYNKGKYAETKDRKSY